MLVELAIGDAFGAGYEFTDDRPANVVDYRQHPKHLLLRPGMYTDDGQMSLGVAEVLLETDDPSYLDFADAWVGCFHRDRRDGYARHFQAFLEKTHSGIDFLKNVRPYSERSGAAMRSVPLGALPDLERVKSVARLQAVLTHNSDGGIHSSMAVALASHFLYYRLDHYTRIGEFVADHTGVSVWKYRYGERHKRKPGNNGIECAHAAFDALQNNDSFSDILLSAVQMGGDTDTVASIACGLASLAKGVEQNVPQKLRDNLEDGSYGRTYLSEIDRRLAEKFPRAGALTD